MRVRFCLLFVAAMGLMGGLAIGLAGCGSAPDERSAATVDEAVSEGRVGAVGGAGDETAQTVGAERVILAFGDSLFAGYGLQEGESYPARLQVALRRQGVNARVINAGVSGDTTAAGLQRIGFVLDSVGEAPDLVIVELGGNDLLRGISPAQTRSNLSQILAELRDRDIPVLLMGMRAPPNLGEEFVGEFDAAYPALAERYGAALVPFFLDAVFDKPELIQQDRIHPTAEGIEALVKATADDVAKALPPRSGRELGAESGAGG